MNSQISKDIEKCVRILKDSVTDPEINDMLHKKLREENLLSKISEGQLTIDLSAILEKYDRKVITLQIKLKDLSPTLLHPRFNTVLDKDNQQLYLIKTDLYRAIKVCILRSLNIFGPERCLIYGGMGIGKSCSLAIAISEIRKEMNLKDIALVYLSNSQRFSSTDILENLFFALEYCFETKADKQIFFASLTKATCCSEVYESKPDDIVNFFERTMMSEKGHIQFLSKLLYIITDERKIKLVFVIDQVPHANSKTLLKELIDEILVRQSFAASVILCSSRYSDWDKYFNRNQIERLSGSFTEDQALVFFKKYFDTQWFRFLTDDEEKCFSNEVLALSGLNPLELSEICAYSRLLTKFTSSADFIADYRVHRQKDIKKTLKAFASSDQWIEYLTRAYLELPISNPSSDHVDQNIAYLEKIENFNGYMKLEFYHASYRTAAFSFKLDAIKAKIVKLFDPQAIAGLFGGSQIPELVKATILEANILNVMVYRALVNQGAPFSFQILKKVGDIEDCSYAFNFIEAVTFYRKSNSLGPLIKSYVSGGKEEKKVNDQQADVALFVPESRSLEGMDAVLIDRIEKRIFLIQITSNIQTHYSKRISTKKRKRGNMEGEVEVLQSKEPANIKTDVKFRQALAGAEECLFNQIEVRELISVLKNELKDYKKQFVWIGLVDGKWKPNLSLQEVQEKIKDIDEESWVIRAETTTLLKPLQTVCGFSG